MKHAELKVAGADALPVAKVNLHSAPPPCICHSPYYAIPLNSHQVSQYLRNQLNTKQVVKEANFGALRGALMERDLINIKRSGIGHKDAPVYDIHTPGFAKVCSKAPSVYVATNLTSPCLCYLQQGSKIKGGDDNHDFTSFAVTTEYMSMLSVQAQDARLYGSVHATDATHKINTDKLPLLGWGVIDKQKHSHLTQLQIADNEGNVAFQHGKCMERETAEALVEMNQATRDNGGDQHGDGDDDGSDRGGFPPVVVPDETFRLICNYSVADNDDAIQGACMEDETSVREILDMEENHVMINCYPHSTRRNRKVLHSVLGEQPYSSFKVSWKILHDCTNYGVYTDCFIPLFCLRHHRGSEAVKTAIKTTMGEYLVPFHGRQNHSRAAVPPGYATSDQGLEGQFRYAKETCFDFKRHSTPHCVDMMFDWIRDHSQKQQKIRPFTFEIPLNGNVAGPRYYSAQKLLREVDLDVVVTKKTGADIWYFPSCEHGE